MSVTVKSLAEAAGVSRGTVDRVLHGRGAVKPEVALRVKALARELGYVPNRAGRALASFKTRCKIGVLLPSIGNIFFDSVLDGISQAQAEFSDMGVDVVVKKLQGYEEQEHLKAIDDLIASGCNGLCIATVNTGLIRDKINDCVSNHIIVVTLNSDVQGSDRLCYVGCDYTKAGRTSAGMLSIMQRPEKLNILIVTGSHLMYGHNQRIEALKDELNALGVDYQIARVVESNDSDIIAQQLTAESLESDPSINCIYVSAAGVQGTGAALIASGRRDIIAIAFDDVYSTKELVRAGVFKFVICQQPERQGYHAVKRAYMAVSGIISDRKVDDFITENLIKIKSNLA